MPFFVKEASRIYPLWTCRPGSKRDLRPWAAMIALFLSSFVCYLYWVNQVSLIREDEIKSCKIASSLVGAAPWLNCRVPGWSCDGSVIWSAKAWNTFNYKVKSMNLKFCLIFVTNSKYDHDFPETWYWVQYLAQHYVDVAHRVVGLVKSHSFWSWAAITNLVVPIVVGLSSNWFNGWQLNIPDLHIIRSSMIPPSSQIGLLWHDQVNMSMLTNPMMQP